jgi:hypothetical protein
MTLRRRIEIRGRRLVALTVGPDPGNADDAADSAGLPVVLTREIGSRQLRFALVPNQPRLRVTFMDYRPPLLGHVTGLDSEEPVCHVAESAHLDWARAGEHMRHIIEAAVIAWRRSCETRECDG